MKIIQSFYSYYSLSQLSSQLSEYSLLAIKEIKSFRSSDVFAKIEGKLSENLPMDRRLI